MEMKRKEMEHPSLFYYDRYSNNSQFPEVGQSLNDYSFDNFGTSVRFFDPSMRNQPFDNIRYSSEHGCLTITAEASSSSPLTSFLCDLSLNLVRGNAHIPEIYTRDLISTIGNGDHYSVDLIPNIGENSSIINGSKDWGLDLSLQM